MSTLPEELKQSELIHQLVLDRRTLETVGRVEQLWMYPKQQRVLGLICQSHLMKGRKCVFKLSQLESLGNNGILVQGQGEDTDAATVRELESLLGYELWSATGDRLGKILDYRFYLKNGYIRHYLWVPSRLNRLTGDLYELPADEVLSYGNQRVLVSDEYAKAPTLAEDGLQQKLRKVKRELQDDYSHLTQSVQSWVSQAQTVALKTKEKAQTWVNQAAQFDPLDLTWLESEADRTEAKSPVPSLEDLDFDDWDETPETTEVSHQTSTAIQDKEDHPDVSTPSASSEDKPPHINLDLNLADHPKRLDDRDWIGDEDALLAAIPEEDLQSADPWI
jgi:uncharacterized protein YrrD